MGEGAHFSVTTSMATCPPGSSICSAHNEGRQVSGGKVGDAGGTLEGYYASRLQIRLNTAAM